MKIWKFKSKELEKQMLSPNESTEQRNIYTNETNDTIDSDISVKVDKKSPNSRKRSVYKSPNVKKSPNELKSKTDNKMIAKNVFKTKDKYLILYLYTPTWRQARRPLEAHVKSHKTP